MYFARSRDSCARPFSPSTTSSFSCPSACSRDHSSERRLFSFPPTALRACPVLTGGAKLKEQRYTEGENQGLRPTTLKGCNGPASILGDCAVYSSAETLVCGHWDHQIVLHLHSCRELGSLRVAKGDMGWGAWTRSPCQTEWMPVVSTFGTASLYLAGHRASSGMV